jgi:hypothetical protein
MGNYSIKDYAVVGIILLFWVLLFIIKHFHYKNLKPVNGEYIFNQPSWMEYLSIFTNIVWVLIFGFGTYYSIINENGILSHLMMIGLTMFGMYTIFKEIRDRHDEIRLEKNQIVVSKKKIEQKFELSTVESVNLIIKKSYRGIAGMKLKLKLRNIEEFTEIEIDNLQEYNEKLKSVLPEYLSNHEIKVKFTYD